MVASIVEEPDAFTMDSITLKMQMAFFSKKFITRYQTMPCHNPKDYIQQYVLMQGYCRCRQKVPLNY